MRRLIVAIIILVPLSLSWYGAEMLIYNYSQKSVVDALIAVGIALSISGRMEKEMKERERARNVAGRFFEGIRKGLAGTGEAGAEKEAGKTENQPVD